MSVVFIPNLFKYLCFRQFDRVSAPMDYVRSCFLISVFFVFVYRTEKEHSEGGTCPPVPFIGQYDMYIVQGTLGIFKRQWFHKLCL